MKTTIEQYLYNYCDKKDKQSKDYAYKQNHKPCWLCWHKDYIILYRNVVWEISGSIQWSFSLTWGWGIYGSIDWHTKTLPILSCRNCRNEKKVATYKYYYEKDKFWDDMHYLYFISDIKKVPDIYLDKPIETREYMLRNRCYEYDYFNKLPYYSTEHWAKAGFKIPKIKKQFSRDKYLWGIFRKWKEKYEKVVYPTWEEFENINKNNLWK